MKRHFIIKFNDLKEDVQFETKESMYKSMFEDPTIFEEIKKQAIANHHDMNGKVSEVIDGLVEQACNRAWVELEIEVKM